MPHLIAPRSRRTWRARTSPQRQRFGPSWLRRRGERGAAALIVTIVVGGFVVTGMAALVVDVGQIYVEREELQSGADATATALAKACADDVTTCATQVTSAVTAATLNSSSSMAGMNAKDGKAAITQICYRTATSGSPACVGTGGPTPETLSSRGSCKSTVPAGVRYVEVHTATKMSDDTTVLPPSFSRALAGNGGYAGSEYHACSRVGWGPPAGGTGFGLTLSECEWDDMTDDGTSYGPVPPSTTGAKQAEGKIVLHGPGTPECQTNTPAGWDGPGGFGWLDSDDNCNTTTNANDGSVPVGVPGADTGANLPPACATRMQSIVNSFPSVLMMPVYDFTNGQGGNQLEYNIIGYSAFVLTGWYWPSNYQDSVVPTSTLTRSQAGCRGNERCIYGYFTSDLVPAGGQLGGGSGFGATIISTIG